MAGQLFEFDPPDRFVAGTVGQPGERTFYLQATGGGRTVSVALEKVQVQALAEKVDELLDEVRRRQGEESLVPPSTSRELEDVAPLVEDPGRNLGDAPAHWTCRNARRCRHRGGRAGRASAGASEHAA